jgi:hypothetical protein
LNPTNIYQIFNIGFSKPYGLNPLSTMKLFFLTKPQNISNQYFNCTMVDGQKPNNCRNPNPLNINFSPMEMNYYIEFKLEFYPDIIIELSTHFYIETFNLKSLDPFAIKYSTSIPLNQLINITVSNININTYNSLLCQYNSTDGLKYSKATLVGSLTKTVSCNVNKILLTNNVDLIDIKLIMNFTILSLNPLIISTTKTFVFIKGKFIINS